jgi:hypothetical protein
MPTLSFLAAELELELELVSVEPDPLSELPHAASVSAAADITAATFIA